MVALEQVLLHIQQVTAVSTQLCDLAERECWDDLLLAWPSYDQATADLPQINWDELSPLESEALKNKLLNLQTIHGSLVDKISGWRSELKDILQNSIQSRKLNNAYGYE